MISITAEGTWWWWWGGGVRAGRADADGFNRVCSFPAAVTHNFLAGAGLPRGQLEVLPPEDEEQEEGQHEELPVPHRHQEDLRRRREQERL